MRPTVQHFSLLLSLLLLLGSACVNVENDLNHDGDSDGFTEFEGDCNDEDASTFPGAAEHESDSACMSDADGDGWGATDSGASDERWVRGTDCDDGDDTQHPGTDELCNGQDDDCDGDVDKDDALDATTWYADGDGDGYGDADSTDVDCDQPTGLVATGTDCDDTDTAQHPGADEWCSGEDDDCDSQVDEDDALDVLTWYADADGDGYGDATIDASGTDYTFLGPAAGDNAGYAVSSAGDVDGDGRDDLLVGAQGDDSDGADAGKAYLILTASLGSDAEIGLANADYAFTGEVAGDAAGCAVSSAGDVDGDGLRRGVRH